MPIVLCMFLFFVLLPRPRGFGFVTYRQSSMVDSAMEDRPHEIDGRELKPKRAVPKDQADDPQAHAEVSHLPREFSSIGAAILKY